MKFKDLYPELAFTDEYQNHLTPRFKDLTSLEGCPKIISGSFDCDNNNLMSLIGGPERVEGHYYCGRNQLTSLDGIASYIGHTLALNSNPIESIAGIHKKITYLGGNGIWIPKSCKNGLLDIFKLNAPNLIRLDCWNDRVNIIFNKYLKFVHSGELTKSQAMLHCQSELIENDLDEFAIT